MSFNASIQNLVIILGDQLDRESSLIRQLDLKKDLVWMAEVDSESTHVPSHRARIALFLSAMRHFRADLELRKIPVFYRELTIQPEPKTLGELLVDSLEQLRPARVKVVEPGDYRVLAQIQQACRKVGLPLDVVPDEGFLCSSDEFRSYAEGRKGLRMEFFYREMRKRTKILMEGAEPEGGQWNYDEENRGSFAAEGPGRIERRSFDPDAITKDVLKLVNQKFKDHPGELQEFDWPVTPAEAEEALRFFIDKHLSKFGQYQDAMWTDQAYLHHSRLSAAMNLKLIRPLHVIQEAEKAYRKKKASLSAVEGFIRQILGWREYVRGIYHLYMPEYIERNFLKANENLPAFYWTGETDYVCLKQAIGQTLKYGYAHHIHRLMVTGLFSLLWGTNPKQIHEWYLAMYVDAVEWVELPNTLGMSQYGDGGVMASKPYIASGKYIQRMSNYCDSCKYKPEVAVGPTACPFSTLYWDFVRKHQDLLKKNPRVGAQVRNWTRFTAEKQSQIEEQAGLLRSKHKS